MRNIFLFFIALSFAFPAFAREETGDKRNLFTLSYQEVEEAVGYALADKGAAEKVAAKINGKKSDIAFSYSKPIRALVRGAQFDKASSHWSANILVMAEEEVVTAFPAAGRFDELVEIPVLKRPVKNGEIIEASNI